MSASVAIAALGQADTIPDSSGGAYVIAAYLVFLVVVVAYVAIMAQRLAKIARTADALEARLDAVAAGQASGPAPAQNSSVGESAGPVAEAEPAGSSS